MTHPRIPRLKPFSAVLLIMTQVKIKLNAGDLLAAGVANKSSKRGSLRRCPRCCARSEGGAA
jgi:hypothetical protein